MNYAKIVNVLSILLIFSLFLLPPATSAQEKEPPVYVEADEMTSTEEKNTVLFVGNVDARQGDLRILSDEMTVHYRDDKAEDKNASTQQKIEKLVSVGNVELSTDEWLGTAKKMIYFSGNRRVHLLGDAKAWQDENMVSGEKIIYYIDEGRSEVVGGAATVVGEGEEKKEKKTRVKMTIMQN